MVLWIRSWEALAGKQITSAAEREQRKGAYIEKSRVEIKQIYRYFPVLPSVGLKCPSVRNMAAMPLLLLFSPCKIGDLNYVRTAHVEAQVKLLISEDSEKVAFQCGYCRTQGTVWHRLCYVTYGSIRVLRYHVILYKLHVPQPLEECTSSVSAGSHLPAPHRCLGYPEALQQAEDVHKAVDSPFECLYNALL